MAQNLTDIDGYGKKEGGVSIGVIGGFLGQLMIVYNTISEYYPNLDRPSNRSHRTRASQDSRPKTPKTPISEKSASKSQRSGQSEDGGNRLIMNSAAVQSFLYNYIFEKLKVESLTLQVDPKYEAFLGGLEKPMAMNEMRTMKEPNYSKFRNIISENLGSPALKLIRDNQEALRLDPDIFDLVYEGFWDLYTFHPMCGDVSAKKLQQWIPKINLQVPEGQELVLKDEEDEADAADQDPAEEVKEDPLCALIRIRIPKQEPAPEYDDEGNVKEVEVDVTQLEEVPFEDRALAVPNKMNGKQIWQVN